MARPVKVGLDYFPLDVVMNNRMGLIEAEFGLNGFAVVVKLFQEIYGKEGYYCEWTNEVALLFAKKNGVGYNVVSEIVNCAVKRGIFNKELLQKYSILTSLGIQSRYIEAKRGKISLIKSEYLLFNVPQIQINETETRVNETKTPVNVETIPQRKEKESKVNENKEKKNKIMSDFEMFWEVYPNKVGKQNAIRAFEKLKPNDELLITIIEAVKKQKNSFQWKKDNGQFVPHPSTWLNQCRWEDELPEEKQDIGYNLIRPIGNNSFNNYTQKVYTNEELMKRAEEKNRLRRMKTGS